MLSLLARFAHLTKLLSRLRPIPFSVQLQDRTTQNLLTFLLCGLGPDLVSIHSVILAAACRPRLTKASRKSRRLGHECAPIFDFSPIWEKEFLAPSMACSTADSFDIVCCLHRDGKLDETPQKKKQKVATGLLRDKLYEQDFHGPISLRTSSGSGTDQSILSCGHPAPHQTCIACFSSWLTVGFLRILCSVLCTAQRFHTKDLNKRGELDVRMNPTPSPTTTNAFLCTICLPLFGDRLPCCHGETIFCIT